MSENYSEAERRLIESRNQPAANQNAVPFSVDQVTTPRIDKKPEAKDVDLQGMVSKVNEASKQQQANAPTVFDTIDKDMPWLKWVGGALGALGTAYGVHKLLGGGDDNTPPPPPGGGSNNRAPSPKDRSFTRTEPTLGSPELTQSSMTAGEPKIVADPVPVAPTPVTDKVTVPGMPDTTASVIPTTDQPKVVPMPSEARPPMQYGETKYNVPTASPEVAVAPPAEVAPTPVEPKTLSKLEELRIQKAEFDLEAAKAKEARAQEAHASRLAADAKRAEEKIQKSQGKAYNNQDNTLLANDQKVKVEKEVEALGNKKAPKPAPAASVVPPADKFVLPISSNPAETALTKEQMSARNWLSSQYGSPSKYFESVQDIHGGVPPSYNAAAGEKAIGKEAHQVIMDWRKANIEGPKVNLTHDMKKVMKGAGGMAVLMALPGFAEAAQNKDVGKMSDIFTDFFVLPFAQSREAGMPKAQEESTIAAKFKEASKLGSPYRSVPPPK